MEQQLLEYLANALWQLPLLACGAWLLLRISKPSPAAQYRAWLGVLALSLLLPLRGTTPIGAYGSAHQGRKALAAAASIVTIPATPVTTKTLAPPTDAIESTNAHPAPRGIAWLDLPDQLFASHVLGVQMSAAAVAWILAFWLGAVLWGFFRLMLAWSAARRLACDSRNAVLAARETALLVECARKLGIAMPRVFESSHIAAPVVVGAVRPALLWPKRFADRSDEELTAALCHEMAHIRRHDYAVNLLCESALLPLRWHPAARALGHRVRATREMACDAAAAQAMQSEAVYATCLVSLAQGMAGIPTEPSLAAGLFNGNVMEERVMRLMQNRKRMSWPARVMRGTLGASALAAAIALAAVFHVAPAMAQNQPAQPTAAPAAQPAPRAEAAPAVHQQVKTHPVQKVPRQTGAVDEKPATLAGGQFRGLTPEERAQIEKKLENAQRRVAEETAKLNSPEFKKRLEDAQQKALQAETRMNSVEFRQELANAQKQMAEVTAKLNSPEFKKKMEDAMQTSMRVNSAEFQKQMVDAQKQIAKTTARLNSPQFQRQIENGVHAAANVNSAEMQKQMAEAQKQIAAALANLKAQQAAGAGK